MKRLRTKPPAKTSHLARLISGQMIVACVICVLQLLVTTNLSSWGVQVRNLTMEAILPTQIESETTRIPVFYNLYASNQSEHDRVKLLAFGQLADLQPFHNPIYVHSIGYPVELPNTALIQHHKNANEHVTLHSLWEHCRGHPNEKVVYLHSKGSFHPSAANDQMRKLLTVGALSDECSMVSADQCNVCSYRFSPFPHPHTPGNMWMAHCSYINKLLDPNVFQNAMDEVYETLVQNKRAHDSCVGKGRYAAEHWVHSHPNVKPCDLYRNEHFSWGYEGLKEFDPKDFKLKPAPRYKLDQWPDGGDYSDLVHRLKEYRLLYNATPADDWWGWNFWLGPSDQPHDPPYLRITKRKKHSAENMADYGPVLPKRRKPVNPNEPRTPVVIKKSRRDSRKA